MREVLEPRLVPVRGGTDGAVLSAQGLPTPNLFTGGQRKYKKLEGWLRARRLLPNGLTVASGAGMPLDRFGNMRQAALTEMLGVIGNQRTRRPGISPNS